MPEGDTVWHTAVILRQALAGKVLTRCNIRVPRYATVDLTGQVVDEVVSRGKHLFIRVGPASIHSHLKMDGSGQVNPARRPSRAGHRIRIILEAGDVQAAGVDLGVLKVLDRDGEMDVVAPLGPDLLGRLGSAHRGGQPGRRPGPADRRCAARSAGDGSVHCALVSFTDATIARLPRPIRPYAERHHELIKFAIVGVTKLSSTRRSSSH